ncbi:U1 small nuclear ribonucleoprotein C [Aplysia californica]|uniref:U1 small nuclear ribonucleoprotein C n=1 Tax=Aplysia californica TaxID=6500 RepID=A0ABM1AAD7_APLCA|nr:U1 small nuclear ribonucleoprotein C [Aplysia californica]
MSYHNMEPDYGQVRVPPGTAPKPYSQGMSYRQGGQSYRQVNIDHYPDDPSGYPPPPPPDNIPKGYSYDPEDDFPPPPPPAPPHAYAEEDGHLYGNIYGGEARYMRTDDYRPPDYQSVSDGPAGYPGESNYANIQINVAPPTPTSKDSPGGHYDHTAGSRAALSSPRSSQGQPMRPASGDRPVPGPMVPPSGVI